MGREVLERIAVYYGSLAERAVVEPTTSTALREAIGEPLPRAGMEFDALLRTIDDVVVRYSRHNGHPRFFGYISSPGTAVAAMAALIEAALNINVSCWRSAPAATEIERVTIGWLKGMLGFPAAGVGLLTSGGSMANLAGLAAARSASGGSRVYVTGEGHFSIRKAAALLGATVREIEGAQDAVRAAEEDRAAGVRPMCIVANGDDRNRRGGSAAGICGGGADGGAVAARGCGVRRVRDAGTIGERPVRWARRGGLGGARSA